MPPVFDVKKYAESLKTEYNIPEEKLRPLLDDKGEIVSGFMRQDDYSRNSQEVQRERQALAAERQRLMEYETWVTSLEQQYGPREQWSEAFARQVGQQNPDRSGNVPAGLSELEVQRRIDAAVNGAVTRVSEQFAQQLEQVGQGSARFAEFYYDANKRWESEYSKPFPKDDFKKFYQENGHTNPNIALQLFESPFKADKQKAEWERQVQEAEQRGELRGRSQASVPGAGIGSWADGGISIGAAAQRTTGADPNANPSVEQREAEAAHAIRDRLEGMNKVTPIGNLAGAGGAAR